ncbi:MAG: tRNA-ribosyltransferase, partial [Natronomonas sp.]
MTEYFEVVDRDGAARRGTIRLSDPRRTPGLVDDVLADGDSQWTQSRAVPEGDESTLTILPHRTFPPGTDDRVAGAFNVAPQRVDYPNAVVISPATADDRGADAYVLGGAPGYVGHAEAFVDALLSVRLAIPDDTALYLPGVATPGNVATLAYAGVDLFDEKRARARGLEGFYLTSDGEEFLEDLEELPCP